MVARRESFRGSVRIVNGRIAETERGATVPAGAVDCEADWLIPGLVDLHTDVLERHAFPRPGVRWPETAAVMAYDAQRASSGITTAFDSLAVGYVFDSGQRPRDPRSLAEAIRQAQAHGILRAEHFLHIRCEVGTGLRTSRPSRTNPLLRLLSLMDHTPGQRQWRVVEFARTTHRRKGLTDPRIDDQLGLAPGRQALHARPIRDGCRRARYHGVVLATHDDTTVDDVEEALALGLDAASSRPPSRRRTRAPARPGRPRRRSQSRGGGSHSGNVAAIDLARRDLLDIISSDYVPASLLHGAYLLHARLEIALPAAIATVTATPAERAGLDGRGGRSARLPRRSRCASGSIAGLPVIQGVWRAGQRVV